MKTLSAIFVLVILLSYSGQSTFAQQNQLKRRQVEQLATVGKVWGFLKYNHPAVASGQLDWDSVLVASVAELSSHGSNKAFHRSIEGMLQAARLPLTTELLPQHSGDSLTFRNYDSTWIARTRLLQPAARKRLLYWLRHPFRGKNFYAHANPDDEGTVITPNEKPYTEMQLPATAYRLLGLFRFWNVINYYYPYKYAIGKPWEEVLVELIPIFYAANDSLSYHKALARLAASIHDSHGGLWPLVDGNIFGNYNSPFNFRIVEAKAVVTEIVDSLATAGSGLQAGSTIEMADGEPLAHKMERAAPYIPASNASSKARSLHKVVFSSTDSTMRLSGYHPDGQRFIASVRLVRRNFLKEHLSFFSMQKPYVSKMLSDSIGYVFFSNLSLKNLDSIMQPLMTTKALVIDLRNYPTSGAMYRIGDYLNEKPAAYALITRPNFSLPGTFICEQANKDTKVAFVGRQNTGYYKGRVVVLVDERTQSAGEWACMILQTAPNVTVVGSQTAGADGNVTRISLPGGYRASFSGFGIYYPDGTETQRVGIKVDIDVRPTVEDLVSQRDAALERAIEFINQK